LFGAIVRIILFLLPDGFSSFPDAIKINEKYDSDIPEINWSEINFFILMISGYFIKIVILQ